MMKVLILAVPLVVVLVLALLLPTRMNLFGVSGATGDGGGLPVRLAVQVAVSIILLTAGLFIILSKRYKADERNWAYASIGTVVGYWLPTAVNGGGS